MFKKEKDLVERSRSLLKKRETKKLKDEILSQLPALLPEQVEEFSPNKCSVEIVKLASRTLLYMFDGVPYFFDEDGRNKLFPTVFFLWRYSHALSTYVIHGPVSEFILNGADLMLPGLASFSGKISVCSRNFINLLIPYYCSYFYL